MHVQILDTQCYINPSLGFDANDSPETRKAEQVFQEFLSKNHSQTVSIVMGIHGALYASQKSTVSIDHDEQLLKQIIDQVLPAVHNQALIHIDINRVAEYTQVQLCGITEPAEKLLNGWRKKVSLPPKIIVYPALLLIIKPYLKTNIHTQCFIVQWLEERVVLITEDGMIKFCVPFSKEEELEKLIQDHILSPLLLTENDLQEAGLIAFNLKSSSLEKGGHNWKIIHHNLPENIPLGEGNLTSFPHVVLPDEVTIDQSTDSQIIAPVDNNKSKTLNVWLILTMIVAVLGGCIGIASIYFLFF